MRVIAQADYGLFQTQFSPDERWICFLAAKSSSNYVLYVVRKEGGEWIRITEENGWADIPRWSPDGKTIYFLSPRETGLFNVWGIHFDPQQGKPLGEPFQVTLFADASKTVWSDLLPHMSMRANRLVLPITDVSGNIWMLDGVDR